MADEEREAIALLRGVQAERARLYNEMDGIMRQTRGKGVTEVKGAEVGTRMEGIKEGMARCSESVRSIEEKLKREDLARLVRQLQEEEKVKLQMTATLHALRQNESVGMWSWQEGGKESMAGPKLCPEEPTQAEFEGAVSEATLLLQACVDKVNDIMDELIQEVEE